jgi:hypothetical protein
MAMGEEMKELEEALKGMFYAGRDWAETYISWFKPQDEDTAKKLQEAMDIALARIEARQAEWLGLAEIFNRIRDNKLSNEVAGMLIGQYAYRYSEGLRLDNAKYARILQNMVEEAEEHLIQQKEALDHPRNRPELDLRFADLREAMVLVATLDPDHYKAPV